MENIFERIDEAQRIINQQRMLKSRQQMLIAPLLMDLERIPAILERVTCIYNNSAEIPVGKYPMRDYFMLVVMLLYSPKVFTGEFLNRGLRDVIAQSLGVTPAHVSNQVRRVWEWCRYYKDFRKGVWTMYDKIATEFQEVGKRTSTPTTHEGLN